MKSGVVKWKWFVNPEGVECLLMLRGKKDSTRDATDDHQNREAVTRLTSPNSLFPTLHLLNFRQP